MNDLLLNNVKIENKKMQRIAIWILYDKGRGVNAEDVVDQVVVIELVEEEDQIIDHSTAMTESVTIEHDPDHHPRNDHADHLSEELIVILHAIAETIHREENAFRTHTFRHQEGEITAQETLNAEEIGIDHIENARNQRMIVEMKDHVQGPAQARDLQVDEEVIMAEEVEEIDQPPEIETENRITGEVAGMMTGVEIDVVTE